jgi:hypothetical protein
VIFIFAQKTAGKGLSFFGTVVPQTLHHF